MRTKRTVVLSIVAFIFVGHLALCNTAHCAGETDGRSGKLNDRFIPMDKPIPFHGGLLVGYQITPALKTSTRLVLPEDPIRNIFLTLKLRTDSPFNYYRGQFRQITLVDQSGKIYQYKGLLTMDNVWVSPDDAPDQKTDDSSKPVLIFESEKYPMYINIHFEVPENVTIVRVRFEGTDQVLFSEEN